MRDDCEWCEVSVTEILRVRNNNSSSETFDFLEFFIPRKASNASLLLQ